MGECLINFIMCKNYDCQIRASCIRYRKIPSKHNQVYYPDNPGDEETCSCFIPNKKDDKLRNQEACDHYAKVGNIADDNVY